MKIIFYQERQLKSKIMSTVISTIGEIEKHRDLTIGRVAKKPEVGRGRRKEQISQRWERLASLRV